MSEYWLISVPGDSTCNQTWEKMNNLTSKKYNFSDNYKFQIPDLKVGTLDQLVGLIDDLGKLDNHVGKVTRKVAKYFRECIKDQDDKLQETLMANNTDLATYITTFQWDMAKYPIKQSLRNISAIISKQVNQIDNLKVELTIKDNLKTKFKNMGQKQCLSLLTRNLGDLVKKEHFILDSEYLMTILVVVPKSSFTDWNKSYEKLTDMIVPRSSELVFEDNDFGLFTVSLFKSVVNNFKLKAHKRKFVVRDFKYNEEEIAAGKNEIDNLIADNKRQFISLIHYLKVNFSECFCAWVHVKALRVFVESILRYGLPVNFQAIVIHPHKKSEMRLRDLLNQLYASLDSSFQQQGIQGNGSGSIDIPGLGFGESDYYPYVFYKINIDMLDRNTI